VLAFYMGFRGTVDVSRVPEVEKGEVLLDSRGRGSFQRRSENG